MAGIISKDCGESGLGENCQNHGENGPTLQWVSHCLSNQSFQQFACIWLINLLDSCATQDLHSDKLNQITVIYLTAEVFQNSGRKAFQLA